MFSYGSEISRGNLKRYLDLAQEKPPINPFELSYNDIEGKHAPSLIEEFKCRIVEITLEKNRNKKEAAKAIGITPQSFNAWLKKCKKQPSWTLFWTLSIS